VFLSWTVSVLSNRTVFRGNLFIQVSSNCALNIIEVLKSIKSDHTLGILVFSLVFLCLSIGRNIDYTFSLVLREDVAAFRRMRNL